MQMLEAKIQAKEIKMTIKQEAFSSKKEATILIMAEQTGVINQVLVLPTFKTQECLMHTMLNAN